MPTTHWLRRAHAHAVAHCPWCPCRLHACAWDSSTYSANWERFVDGFAPLDPSLFASPSFRKLGARLETWSAWVAAQISPSPDTAHATLIHGDFKDLNVFLPSQLQSPVAPQQDLEALLIDFASTGVGFGMSDVATLLSHSMVPDDLAGDGDTSSTRSTHATHRTQKPSEGVQERPLLGGGEQRLLDVYVDSYPDPPPLAPYLTCDLVTVPYSL